MSASASDLFTKAYPRLTTTLSANKSAGASSMSLNSAVNWPTDTGVLVSVYNLDSNNDIDADTLVVYSGVVSGSDITNLSVEEGDDQLHNAGSIVSLLFTAEHWNRVISGLLAEHGQDGGHDATKVVKMTGNQTVAGNKTFSGVTTAEKLKFNAPQGFLINGKIVASVASNNLTVAIKGLDDNDPSATNPVYCRIGNTVRSITAALSVTKNAGTNWCDSGSANHATQDIDYFVYLGYNATDGVVIGFSRIPYGRVYSDFSATSTDEKYCAISTITNAASTDEYEVVGRFNAALSASASFNWSIPATAIVINRPIFETRWLSWVPTLTSLSGGTITNARYVRKSKDIHFRFVYTLGGAGVSGGIAITLPVESVSTTASTSIGTARLVDINGSSYEALAIASANTTGMAILISNVAGTYPTITALSSTIPFTWAVNDVISAEGTYEAA